jgi:hypothetical protein
VGALAELTYVGSPCDPSASCISGTLDDEGRKEEKGGGKVGKCLGVAALNATTAVRSKACIIQTPRLDLV